VSLGSKNMSMGGRKMLENIAVNLKADFLKISL
jgi:hypothetical protein